MSPERWFPLRVVVCESCWLVQTEDYATASELFDSDYAYFSGFSSSWVDHCAAYTETMVDRFRLDGDSTVVEVASNDGTLLSFFAERGLSCIGIEPTASTAEAARELGLDVVGEFLTVDLADRLSTGGLSADLLVANNVVAHVPDIVGFVSACGRLLGDGGVATFEFPHLLQLVSECQFDTIYHEHFSYLSLTSFEHAVVASGLEVFDVEELATHGGSLRVFVQPAGSCDRSVESTVGAMLHMEEEAGVQRSDYYAGFQAEAEAVKDELLRFLLKAKTEGRLVLGLSLIHI